MVTSIDDAGFEQQVTQWREYLKRRPAVTADDADELEAHLRDQATDLVTAGLSHDEAFLVAVKRIGAQDAVSREFARAHSGRLWKQLVLADAGDGQEPKPRRELWVVLAFAVLAGLAVKAPELFGLSPETHAEFYAINASLFITPVLAVYFARRRDVSARTWLVLASAFVAALVVANGYPFHTMGDTFVLAALHLPIVMWLVVGVAYVGGDWRAHGKRMDFIRFTGEWVIYMALIAMGGGVLTGVGLATFSLIGVDVGPFVAQWLIPCGAAGATVVAAWLVEAKQGVIENMAPVLTRIFTPLFAALLVAVLVGFAVTGLGGGIDRDALIVLNLVLVVVLGLVLYSVSARESGARPGLFDYVQWALVAAALLVDAVVLTDVLRRIGEFGFTANRTAALGENLVLLTNLAWSAWLALRFIRGRRPVGDLERWQTAFVPVYLVWAAVVVVVFPLVFEFR
jgi:hypothetical protein